jgi:hypothetical protein
MIFSSFGPITLDLSSLLSFILGLAAGFLILFLFYIYAVIRSMNKGLRLRKSDEEDIDEEEIKWLIDDAIDQFLKKDERKELGYYKHLLETCKDLSIDIAKKFYPMSKYPHLELTIDEALHLNHYITNRVDELLKGRILRLVRGYTLVKIVEANEFKESIENTKIVQAAKKYKVHQILKTTVSVVNAVNPVYWTRKLIINKGYASMMNKIGKAIIAVTGEETYKIYSKKVFSEEKTIDAGVHEIYHEIAKDAEEFEVAVHEEKQGKPTT